MSKSDCERKIDRLSNLHPYLIDDILVLLPLRDAVRTSILSRYWRYRWASIPQLVFNQECTPTHVEDNDLDNYLLRINIVDKVLSFHGGPIHKFKCSEFVAGCPDIGRWIVHLSNHGIKEFSLHLVSRSHSNLYQVPSDLFSCHDLRKLELTNCTVETPPAFKGFANLTNLVLNGIKISDEALKHLVSKCRLLKILKLKVLDGITHIEIHSRSLKTIFIYCAFEGLHLSTPHLIYVGICLPVNHITNEDHSFSFIEALGSLHSLQKLGLSDSVVQKFIPVGKTPQKQFPTYKRLKHLFLSVNFSSFTQMTVACCFMASALRLERLSIHSTLLREGSNEHKFDWKSHGYPLPCLRSMEMHKANGSENELGLLEVVLANAPLLSSMTVFSRTMSKDQETKFLKRLIQFRRASPQATVRCR